MRKPQRGFKGRKIGSLMVIPVIGAQRTYLGLMWVTSCNTHSIKAVFIHVVFSITHFMQFYFKFIFTMC